MKDDVLFDFNVTVLDDSNEDILWLKLSHKRLGYNLIACVCYLPPENSSRQVDVNAFFDTILTGVYNFQSIGKLFICGDLNSRCGAEDDFIVGVDDIVQRNIIDYKTNNYEHILIEFLINSNMCILNGRNTVTNDFTSVSSKGTSVVDYCIVNHEDLSMFQDFHVLRVNDMLNASGAVGRSFVPTSLPDHSCLLWHISVEEFGTTASEVHEREAEHKCYIGMTLRLCLIYFSVREQK